MYVMRPTCPRLSNLFLLHQLVLLAIVILVRNSWIARSQTRKYNFLLLAKILERTTYPMNCHELRVMCRLARLPVKLIDLILIFGVMYWCIGWRVAKLVWIRHDTWGVV